MDNMEFNNNNAGFNNMEQQNQQGQMAQPFENTGYPIPEPAQVPAEPEMYGGDQRNGYINIQSVPVKKHKFRRAIPMIACTLVAAILGGVAGGAYVNNMVDKNANAYQTPVTISQSTGGNTNTVSYTPPTSLIAKIAAEVGPAIVGVDTQVVAQGFFGQQQVAQDSGSGIIFDKRGYIVTNQHVIDGAKGITVTLPGSKKYPAQVIGQDTTSDLAVLKINADNLPVAKFGDSSKVRVGDLAIAIGNPMGESFAGSVTSGIISALNRTINMNDGGTTRRYKLIQTDAAINPGNSGGALINENGEVIGINSIKFVDAKVEGMNFAIPINDAKTVIDQLLNNGYVSRPWLGVNVITVSEDEAKQINMPAGVGVEQVIKGSGAEAAGIKPRDIILAIDDLKVATSDELINELQKHKVGDSVKLKIWRDGKELTLSVTLGENKVQSN